MLSDVKRRLATKEEANALGSAMRLRIVRLTFQRPMTNKEIAQRLGKDPATTLHHVRKLVAAGFLAAQPARAGNRGAREIPYLSTGLSWQLDWSEQNSTQDAMLQAFLAEIADVGDINQVDQTRLIVQVDPEELNRRLRTLFDELAAQPPEPGAPRVAIYLAVYPGD